MYIGHHGNQYPLSMATKCKMASHSLSTSGTYTSDILLERGHQQIWPIYHIVAVIGLLTLKLKKYIFIVLCLYDN